jgi:hypothetical protein
MDRLLWRECGEDFVRRELAGDQALGISDVDPVASGGEHWQQIGNDCVAGDVFNS